MVLRVANMDDAMGIARCHVRSWQRTYRGHLSDRYLDNLNPGHRAKLWTNALSDEDCAIAVCESGSDLLGFVSLRASADNTAKPGSIELTAIYVDPGHWRQGIGSRLITWAHEWARERRVPEMTLWVLRENDRAKAFYQHFGWKETQDLRKEAFGGSEITEVRYRWQGIASPT